MKRGRSVKHHQQSSYTMYMDNALKKQQKWSIPQFVHTCICTLYYYICIVHVSVHTYHTLYLDPQTECATMCVTVGLMSPRTVAPIKWARLHRDDASDLFLKPVKQTTRPSMVQEQIGRVLLGRAWEMKGTAINKQQLVCQPQAWKIIHSPIQALQLAYVPPPMPSIPVCLTIMIYGIKSSHKFCLIHTHPLCFNVFHERTLFM